MIRVGLVGLGAIGSAIVAEWAHLAADYQLAAVCVRPSQLEAAHRLVSSSTRVVSSADALLDENLELIIEAAGHRALMEVGEPALAMGKKLYALSIGALADEQFSVQLRQAGAKGGGHLLVPSGALAGFDGLMTLRESGLDSVRYVSIKPPLAWRGTPAEEIVQLAILGEPTTFFRGSAREAARLFPKNANLAAAVALAGIGFDDTEVELIADPTATTNTGRVLASTQGAKLVISLEGQSLEGNPKSSAIVGTSVISSLKNSAATVSFC